MPKTLRQSHAEVLKTGEIWRRPRHARERLVRAVCHALAASYPPDRLGNPRQPLADLIYITISNRTTPEQAMKTYRTLRRAVRSWEDLLSMRPAAIEKTLRPAGLSAIKAAFIVGIARALFARFGRVTLAPLRRMSDTERLQFLTSLPGVSDKVARCVMMYCFDSAVLPVDVHLHRLAKRLGWTARKRADQSHEELEALIPPEHRFRLHVAAILHGRAICGAADPACAVCVLRQYCPYGKQR